MQTLCSERHGFHPQTWTIGLKHPTHSPRTAVSSPVKPGPNASISVLLEKPKWVSVQFGSGNEHQLFLLHSEATDFHPFTVWNREAKGDASEEGSLASRIQVQCGPLLQVMMQAPSHAQLLLHHSGSGYHLLSQQKCQRICPMTCMFPARDSSVPFTPMEVGSAGNSWIPKLHHCKR